MMRVPNCEFRVLSVGPKGWCIAVLLGMLIFAGMPAQAQQVRAYLSADSVRVGDRFNLTLVAEHQFTADPVFPPQEAGQEFFGDLEVLAIQSGGSRLATEATAGTRVDSLIYEVTTFAIDTAYVPSIPVFFVAGEDTTFFASYPIDLPVISLVPAEAEGIRDLAPIAEFPINPWRWILIALIVAGLLAGLYYLWKRRQSMPKQTVLTVPEPEISPIDQAIQRLRALEKDANLKDTEQIKPFYVELTEILRVYLSRRLRINAMESTSFELNRDLGHLAMRKRIPENVAHLTKRVLQVSDLVKFADMQPAPEVGMQAFVETRKILDEVEASLKPSENEATGEVPEAQEALASEGESNEQTVAAEATGEDGDA